MKNEKFSKEPTKAQIKEWEEDEKVKVITLDRKVDVDDEGNETVIDEGVTGYFRKPDRATIKFANAKFTRADGAVDPISPGEVILNRCWLGGNPKMKSEDKYFFRVCIELNGWLNDVMGFTSSS